MGDFAYAEESNLTAIASAIRSVHGSSSKYSFPLGFVDAINLLVPQGMDALWAQDKLKKISDSTISFIGSYAFYSCSRLQEVHFPNVLSISEQAFSACRNLTNADFPKCTYIGYGAFANTHLSTINFPSCTYISDFAFYYIFNMSMSLLSLPKCSFIGYRTFESAGKFGSIYLPECLELSYHAFANIECASFYLPKCITVGEGAFERNSTLTSITLPKCTQIFDFAFRSCSNLTMASLSVCSYIHRSAFRSCPNFRSLYLFSTSVVYLYAVSNGNSSTLFDNIANINIYVPNNLLSNYKTSYSRFSSIFIGM